ncbi:endonuclease domain-containing protein [Microbacterium sp.]|uniref:endonuclease domain-containing protein n=1 Tax=Microbacterium sp. TaxID=51671 RepID=UPI0039E49589
MQARRWTRLLRAMNRTSGVARVERLLDEGVSRYDIDTALKERLVVRVRQGWVALPDADRMLVAAARCGVVLTCVTRARRLGVWVHDEDPIPHLGAVRERRYTKPHESVVHWGTPVVPRHPDALEDPIENALVMIAACEPFEQALASWDSALNKGLVTRQSLERLDLRPVARRILAECWPFADAGLETYFRPRLRWLRLPMYFQSWISGHRVDVLIGDRLVVQIDGGTHVGEQRAEDIRHDAELKLLGYHVIRVSYHQVMKQWHVVQDLIMRAVAQGLHLARSA